jgi:aminoglycoside phosphotransferase (APT) family kinase protein
VVPLVPTPSVIAAAARAAGERLRLVGPTRRGESKSTYLLAGNARGWILKIQPDSAGALDNQFRLLRLVDAVRRRGCPAPVYAGAGKADAVVWTVQERLPGRTLEAAAGAPPDAEMYRRVLPAVLSAVEAQADLGDLPDPPWPAWLLDTIDHGGDGYCLHTTMRQRADTSALLDRLIRTAARLESSPARSTDIVHFDLNPANILVDHGRLSGIIDWNVTFAGSSQGDRGFDVATLLFYSYDVEATRPLLWDTASSISGVGWTSLFLIHLILRQVEWSVRHRPGSAEAARFLAIASHVLDDCDVRQG